ncbi:MAG: hypothetical protein EBR41_05080 [Crocinitomicaceae bacterium]|nr:hypothetical protein [Crocinitomicaceae bacterium]
MHQGKNCCDTRSRFNWYAYLIKTDRAVGTVQYARSKAGSNRKVGCLIQDATRIPIARLFEVCKKLVDAGADMIELDDINGMAIYPVYTYVVREMKRLLPNTIIGLHTHNDIGLGTASLYAGLEGGADKIDACVNGLGERAQIAPLAEVATVIQIYYGIDCGIKLDKMTELSQLVADLTKVPLSETMPIVGKTAFTHLVEVHYAVPDSDEGFWSFLSMRPEIFGNSQKVHSKCKFNTNKLFNFSELRIKNLIYICDY